MVYKIYLDIIYQLVISVSVAQHESNLCNTQLPYLVDTNHFGMKRKKITLIEVCWFLAIK